MKKADLRTGMVVETRNGDKYLVMRNPDYKDIELISFNGGYLPLYYYNDELIGKLIDREFDREYDIVKVYSVESSICWLLSDKERMEFKLIWERKEGTKEMTIAEIEKELGYKIKIVGDEDVK